MSLDSIRAHISCDGCGAKFSVGMDPAHDRLPIVDGKQWALFDLAEDAVRGVVEVHAKTDGSTSVQGGKMLCPACTSIVDGFVTEERNATADEVEAALRKAVA
jgi:hypothetical protein